MPFAAIIIALTFTGPAQAEHRPDAAGIYALVVECTADTLLCFTHRPVRFDTWPECEAYIAHARTATPRFLVMGRCRSWRPPMGRDYREK